MKKNLKNLKGITLISLVVTIIVLLILAGISVTTITSNNGILTRAKEAKEQTVIGQEKESVELAYITAAMKKLGDDVTANELQDELDAMLGDTEETDETKKKTNVKQNSNNTINVLFRATQHNYNVNQGKVAKVLEDGIYVGNVRMGGIYLPDFSGDESYEDYESRITEELYSDESPFKTFWDKCNSKTATKSNYEDAVEIAERYGISTEWIDYAYNNQGDIIRNIQAPTYTIERTGEYSWDVSIPLNGDITSEDQNFRFDFNLDLMYTVELRYDAETGDMREWCPGYIPSNPESISWNYRDSNQELPDEIQLPFGMVLKYAENPYTAEDFIDEYTTQEEAIQKANDENSDKRGNCVIEWQGQTFNVNQLRKFVMDNTKIVYNGQTLNMAYNHTEKPTTGYELYDLFGFDFVHLYKKGYLP